MKHLGDITKISGYDAPIVDVITGGSPCQDLSIAGKRAGLEGERSGLFMEQIRIAKEMRERDRATGRTGVLVRPRYMVWENVQGAFSSNGGKDFQAVLTEIVRIADPSAPDVPMPDRGGGWQHCGCLYDELGRWSVAWRLHDAQYWGVPQRRKRLCVLADFNGLTAPWILFDPQFERTSESGEPVQIERDFGGEPGPEVRFERESVSGHFEPCEEARERAAAGAESGAGSAISIQGNTIDRDAKQHGGGLSANVAHTLNGVDRHAVSFRERAGKPGGAREYSCNLSAQEPCQPSITRASTEPILLESNQNHATVQTDGVSTALPASMGEGGGYVPMITAFAQNQRGEARDLNDVAGSLAAEPGMKQQTFVAAGFKAGQSMAGDIGWQEETAATLSSNCSGTEPTIYAVDARNATESEEVNGTLQGKASNNLNSNNVVRTAYGLEPGAAQRLDPEGRIWKEIAPTMRANPRDNGGGNHHSAGLDQR